MRRIVRFALPIAALLAGSACSSTPAPNGAAAPTAASDDALTARARAIHQRVMTLDTHVDIEPAAFQVGQLNYGQRLNNQVDLTKMEEGKLDAIFFSIYVGQGALDAAGYARAYATDTAKFNAVHRLAEQIAPNRIAIAYTADDARRIYASGKKVAFMGVENGYGIDSDITRVKEFYDRGARYMSLAHNGHNQLSDSNTGEADNVWSWHGISPLGKQVITEMNRLGMMIDISHPSRESMMQTLALSKAPIIASHSGVRALCNVSRNLDDEQLKALGKNGGVVQMVAFRSYVKCDPAGAAAKAAAQTQLYQEFAIQTGGRGGGGGRGGAAGGAPRGPVAGTPGPSCSTAAGGFANRATVVVDSQVALMSPAKQQQFRDRQRALDARYPTPAIATVKDFVDHIDYGVKLIGLDHIGISSDFDGGGGLDGYNCALEAINVTKELVRRGYTEEQIGKIWSGNLLRVLGEVEKVARKIQAGEIKS
ncbi:MAG: peptidase [Gemmatimonadetes bacterium]|nr:peptidase [Gemmatimonadota bacterium]